MLERKKKKMKGHQKKKMKIHDPAASAVEISSASATKILAASTTEISRERDYNAANVFTFAHQSLDSAKFHRFSARLLKDKDPGAGMLQKEEEKKNGKRRKKKMKNENNEARNPLALQTTYAASNLESPA